MNENYPNDRPEQPNSLGIVDSVTEILEYVGGLDEGEVTQESRLGEDLEFMQVDILHLVTELKRRIGIDVSIKELSELVTEDENQLLEQLQQRQFSLSTTKGNHTQPLTLIHIDGAENILRLKVKNIIGAVISKVRLP